MKQNFNNQSHPALFIRELNDTYRLAKDEDILNAAISTINTRFSTGTAITAPAQAHDFIRLRLAPYPHEVFGVLWLTTRHTVIAFEELFRGTLAGASVYPREVVKSALKHNAGACILAHNHPSGVVEPSHADETITKKIQAALDLVEVRTLDHVIVGERVCSFAERGLL